MAATPGLDPGAEAEMELDVGRARVLVGVPEAAGLEEARGDRARAWSAGTAAPRPPTSAAWRSGRRNAGR